MDKNKIININFIFLLIWFTGTILTINFVPLQDYSIMSEIELLITQRELAINYWLGIWIVRIAKFCLVSFNLYLWFSTKDGSKTTKKLED
ncbi:MAG: hypothetical protein LBV67_06970 [Streptococcaceae bacterium]|jgi:hypothetical protein|nr:hypothetical protein [Streptococcaceae bacterium]